MKARDAQALMDCLWQLGIRPSKGIDSKEMNVAVGKHLSDMRKIVSKKLGVEL